MLSLILTTGQNIIKKFHSDLIAARRKIGYKIAGEKVFANPFVAAVGQSKSVANVVADAEEQSQSSNILSITRGPHQTMNIDFPRKTSW